MREFASTARWGITQPRNRPLAMLCSSYLEQVLVVLPLEEHDAVLEEEHVQVDRLEALRLAQLHRQLAVVDQAVLAQVKVLAKGEKESEVVSEADWPKY